MVVEKTLREILGAIPAAYCDHGRYAVYSKERPIVVVGREARRLA
jgi:hypothetical protein